MTEEYFHNGKAVAPWDLHKKRPTKEGHRMVSMRLRESLAARIDDMAGYLGTGRSQFMRHAVVLLLTEEENRLREETTTT